MRKRRFSITKEEADIVILALSAAITDIETNDRLLNDAYIRWKYHAMRVIKENLELYQWEIE